MSDQDPNKQSLSTSSMKDAFKPGKGIEKPALFTSDEMDIYCNKVTLETYIFHGKEVDYDPIAYMEYDPKHKTVDIVMKDNTRMDLGVKIQWLVRPYFTKAKEVSMVRTKDREPIDGAVIALIHKGDPAPPPIH
ncbi:MAG: hypothetical protein AB8B83_07050 [Bdellovibrionales bacterium]